MYVFFIYLDLCDILLYLFAHIFILLDFMIKVFLKLPEKWCVCVCVCSILCIPPVCSEEMNVVTECVRTLNYWFCMDLNRNEFES